MILFRLYFFAVLIVESDVNSLDDSRVAAELVLYSVFDFGHLTGADSPDLHRGPLRERSLRRVNNYIDAIGLAGEVLLRERLLFRLFLFFYESFRLPGRSRLLLLHIFG